MLLETEKSALLDSTLYKLTSKHLFWKLTDIPMFINLFLSDIWDLVEDAYTIEKTRNYLDIFCLIINMYPLTSGLNEIIINM